MANRRVTLEQLPDAINEILEEYQDDTIRSTHVVVRKVAQAGAKAINSAAGSTFKGKRYRSSWTVESENTRLDAKATIYSKIPGLPHLLEHGHAGRNGGRGAAGRIHIKPVEETLVREFEEELKVALL